MSDVVVRMMMMAMTIIMMIAILVIIGKCITNLDVFYVFMCVYGFYFLSSLRNVVVKERDTEGGKIGISTGGNK